MKLLMKHLHLLLALNVLLLLPAMAQDTGRWSLTAYGNYSQPFGSLSDWFKATANFGLGIGQQINEDWNLQGLIEYTHFDEENLSGYAKDHVELSLEHVGLMVNGKYQLKKMFGIQPYFNLGGGLFYWKGFRGEIEANPNLDPSLPYIEKRILEEWNWGFRTGLGVEYFVLSNLALDVGAYYRMIIGDLWPTLQPHIELESVSGFQTINLAVSIQYYF